MRDYMRAYRRSNPERELFNKARRRAARYGIPFEITLADIRIPAECPALGIRLQTNDGVARDNSPTLDRIIPEKGYVPGNVMVLSHKANRMKNSASSSELLRLGCYFQQHYPNQEEP